MNVPSHRCLRSRLKGWQFALLVSLAADPGLTQVNLPRDLSEFSLEDLMSVQVTSVSKKEQKLSQTGAAVYVLTAEDIRRWGATNIPDLLRMVPGVDVAFGGPGSRWK